MRLDKQSIRACGTLSSRHWLRLGATIGSPLGNGLTVLANTHRLGDSGGNQTKCGAIRTLLFGGPKVEIDQHFQTCERAGHHEDPCMVPLDFVKARQENVKIRGRN
jgi:hypothetical protein